MKKVIIVILCRKNAAFFKKQNMVLITVNTLYIKLDILWVYVSHANNANTKMKVG